jgi:CheY-specific phosphatase CheX
MFEQFFGGFLLNKGVVSSEQLINAMKKESTAHIQLGTLAMHASLMDAAQIEDVRITQTHTDKRFGEICIDKGYLTAEQVDELLASQYPKYLLLGQILEEQGVFDQATFNDLVHEYVNENSINEDDLPTETGETVLALVTDYCADLPSCNKTFQQEYLQLLLNNLIRFIGSDFMLLRPVIRSTSYPTQKFSAQKVTGDYEVTSILDMSPETAVEFASRYVSETFTEFDEYVQASMEDFLNLHNGLFNVNISNTYSVELGLDPPISGDGLSVEGGSHLYIFPALYPFGVVNLVMSEN